MRPMCLRHTPPHGERVPFGNLKYDTARLPSKEPPGIGTGTPPRQEVLTMSKNQQYVAPKLVTLGNVADLTKTGTTNTGPDMKTGSVSSSGL